jgi:bacteriocin-like protein
MAAHDTARHAAEIEREKSSSELSEEELDAVSGGTDAEKKKKTEQVQYLEIKLTDVLISG